MDLDRISTEQFKSICNSSGINCRDVEFVREKVYRVKIENSNGDWIEVYGKLYPNYKEERIRSLVQNAREIGLPDARVASDDFVILLLNSATGQPLSYVLPVVFLPGIWKLWKNRIKSGYSNLGWYLGTQHARTEAEEVELLSQSQASKFQSRTKLLDDDVPELTQSRIETIVDEARNRKMPQAFAHSDPSPHNIFYKAGDVTLIDNAFSRKVAGQDHANALLGIWLMVGRLPYARQRIGRELENAYWQGHKSRGITASTDRAEVGILLLRKYLSLVDYYNDQPEILHAKATGYVDKPAIVAGVRRELRILADAGVCEL